MQVFGLLISFARQCPLCGNVHVSKTRRHCYECDHCSYEFWGYKFGPLRIAF